VGPTWQAALERDIKQLMAAWTTHLKLADLLFVHAGGINGNPLFVGEGAALSRNDPRLRPVPFNTRRPTFGETQRVVKLLAQVRQPPHRRRLRLL
jgi:hypothetical protein